MTDTTATPSAASPAEPAGTAPVAGGGTRQRRGTGLSAMLLPELKQMAGGLGIKGTGAMRKSQLVDAIKAAQSGGPARADVASEARDGAGNGRVSRPTGSSNGQPDSTASAATDVPVASPHAPEHGSGERTSNRQGDDRARQDRGRQDQGREEQDRQDQNRQDEDRQDQNRQGDRQDQGRQDQGRQEQGRQDQNRQGQNRQGQNRQDQDRPDQDRPDQNRQGDRQDQNRQADEDGGRRNRRRRGRDRNDRNDRMDRSERADRTDRTDRNDRSERNRNDRGGRGEPDTTVLDDDVLVPAAGILDVLDNYAFVRTSGYLPGPEDVYVSLSMVRRYGLRRGDAVIGQVRQPREGDRKEKFNPLVRIDTVNGADPETARHRVEFQKLTPLYASQRLRLETVSTNLIGRVIDIAAPIGKGQRGLIVSPSKAGKTMIMQSIANSITTNNPECHLMVVLVDERPEEVTDFERSVKGEVISSTFDRPAGDHTAVAELAIERAKRLVELGHDVVVLLDGITRLGRAYNLAAPASGRILSGGVDSAALYPPKRFFGAARNIEDGGSLTILATALIESGSKMDEVIFEEFKGTGNMEIRLRRDFADKRIFPAIDAVQSGTRREELLMSKEELSIVWKLRRVLSGLDSQQALELLLERLKKSSSNIEFLTQVQKTTPTAGNGRDD